MTKLILLAGLASGCCLSAIVLLQRELSRLKRNGASRWILALIMAAEVACGVAGLVMFWALTILVGAELGF